MGFLKFLLGKKRTRHHGGALSGTDRELIRREWGEVAQLLALDTVSSRRDALVRADRVLDSALQKLAPGETVGERLKNARDKFPNHATYDGLWKAHKLRNALVHEAGFDPPHPVVSRAIEQIGEGLRSLRISV